jgi:hypothetical protein
LTTRDSEDGSHSSLSTTSSQSFLAHRARRKYQSAERQEYADLNIAYIIRVGRLGNHRNDYNLVRRLFVDLRLRNPLTIFGSFLMHSKLKRDTTD